MDSIVAAEYELEHLLLEGHCFDVSTGQPPRGLQFTLGTASDPVIVDTIVMANLVRDFMISLCAFILFFYFFTVRLIHFFFRATSNSKPTQEPGS